MGERFGRRLAFARPATIVRSASLIAITLFAAACAPPRAPEPALPRVSAGLLPFLLDPERECGAGPVLGRQSGELHRRLVASGDGVRIELEARALLEREPGAPAALAALAQALLVGGNAAGAAASSAAGAPELAACPALALARGRALEDSGDLTGAFGAYRLVSSVNPIASRRAAEISAPAREGARGAFTTAMAKGHLEAAGYHLEQLELWWARSEPALRSRLEMAAATHDVERELAAARALHQANSDDRELTLLRARLELEAGDARTGLELVQALARAAPSDPAIQRELERARFEWRLQNAPEGVRRLARHPEATRADLAELVYWMVPPVRTARPGGGRIASDVLDLESREEIVRMVNLGLMSVDETLHRFAPASPVRQGEALRTYLRLLRFLGASSCAGSGWESGDGACGAALACGLIETQASCNPGRALSGRELVELLRLTLVAAGES